jgi:SpoVK/Ycf46/Vps4 family AAA+-type ATPase
VLESACGPGDTLLLPELAGLPLIVLAGPDGAVAAEPGSRRRLAVWKVPLPDLAARGALWHAHLGDACGALPQRRMSAAHIDALAAAAAHQARLAGRESANPGDVQQAAQASSPGGLAQAVDSALDARALVLPPTTRTELDALLARCRVREGLVDSLGAASRARARLGVAALFTGPSGTGKTLACAWLAQRLALPLWRVDTAAVTSKYIGETEKNLGQVLARAEAEGVALLFDEADALFGKRTDVRDANDRYANQQTNYLLQRIESFDGIAFLTSNSRSRFDAAFTRRLDAIVDFAAPGPEERRALWLAHLGDAHPLTPAAINQLAANIDLSGGHIRNVVLAAAAAAHSSGRALALDDLRAALEAEYRKLGRQMPGTTNLFKP